MNIQILHNALEKLLKKINLIQEFEFNVDIDESIFIDKLKKEFKIKRSKREQVLDAFMSEEDYLKIVFNKDNFVLKLELDLWRRNDFMNLYNLVCKIEDSKNGFKIKAKLFSEYGFLLIVLFIIALFFLLMLIIDSIIQGEYFFLLSMPMAFILFGVMYSFQISYLKRLKNSALELFKKLN